MAQRIYLVTQNGIDRLVRAHNPNVARSFVARDTIHVCVAGQDDIYEMARDGVKVEETTENPDQLDLLA